MFWNKHIKWHNSQIPPYDNLNKEKNSGSVEYANCKICILQSESFEDCNNMQPSSSDSLTLFVYTTRCSDDFQRKQGIKQRNCRTCKIQICNLLNRALLTFWLKLFVQKSTPHRVADTKSIRESEEASYISAKASKSSFRKIKIFEFAYCWFSASRHSK